MKTPILAVLIGAALLALDRAGAQAAVPAEAGGSGHYRANYELAFGQYAESSRSPRTTGAPPAAKKSVKIVPAPPVQCSEMHTGPVRLSETMPSEAVVGQEFLTQIKITALDCAANVVVTDLLPPGLTYVRSDPTARVEGDKLVWKMARLDSGVSGLVKLWLRAEREGTLVNCATVSADPVVCAAIVVGRPTLSISHTGPGEVRVGESAKYSVVVRNIGSATARDVVVTDTVPDGLRAADDQQRLTFNLGDLAPGQAKSIPMAFGAARRGNWCNQAVASASNTGSVEARACTDIVKHALNLRKTAPDKQLGMGRVATYTLTLDNPGDRVQTGVVLTDTAAHGTTIAEAPGATTNGNVATWNVGAVEPGASKDFTIKIRATQPGRYCDVARVTSVQGAYNEAQACTDWGGVAGVRLEKTDFDPIPEVGSTTVH